MGSLGSLFTVLLSWLVSDQVRKRLNSVVQVLNAE